MTVEGPHIALLQMCSGREIDANLETAARLIGDAAEAGGALAVLPENFAQMDAESRRREIAEAPGQGPLQNFLSRQARDHGLWLVGGTIPLRRENERAPVAAALVYDDRGVEVTAYDKIHLFDVGIPDSDEGYLESKHTTPGSKIVCVDSPAGRLGVAVCYDIRFPELIRALADDGMEVLVLPAAFTATTGKAHWEVLLRARAIENLCYVAAAAQAGSHENGRVTWGHSMLVNPWGTIVAELPTGVGVLEAAVDLEQQTRTRDRFPALAHRIVK